MAKSISRRNFLRGAACTAGASLGAGLIPNVAKACTPSLRHLVVIYLNGGYDWLHWMMPTNSATLEQIRPTLYAPLDRSRTLGTSGWSLNSNLANLHALYNAGKVAFLPFTHYANFSGSHDDSRIQYLRGLHVRTAMMNAKGMGIRVAEAHSSFNSSRCVMSTSGSDELTTPAGGKALNFNNLSDMGFGGQAGSENGFRVDTVFGAMANLPAQNFAQQELAQAWGLVESDVSVLQQISSTQPNYGLNTGIARDLQEIEALIRAFPNQASINYLSFGGHDTHNAQNSANLGRQTQFDQAVNAFMNSTADIGDNVGILVMSEFGRTNRENGNFGTDHGGSTLMMWISNRAIAGVYGNTPTADELLAGSNGLPKKLELVGVQYEILSQFLGLGNVAQVFPGFSYTPIGFVA